MSGASVIWSGSSCPRAGSKHGKLEETGVVEWVAWLLRTIAECILPFLKSWAWIPWYTIALLHVAGALIGVISVLAMFLIWL